MESCTGFSIMVFLESQGVGKSNNTHTMTISNYSPTSQRTRVTFSHSIKFGFMPTLTREFPLHPLYFHSPILFPLLTIASFIKISPLSYNGIFSHIAIDFIYKHIRRNLPVSKNLIVSILPYSPTEVGQIPYAYKMQISTFVQIVPLKKEVKNITCLALNYPKVLCKTFLDLHGKREIYEDVINHLQLMLIKNTSIRDILPSFCQIIQSENFILKHQPEEDVDFRGKARELGLSPRRFLLQVPKGFVS